MEQSAISWRSAVAVGDRVPTMVMVADIADDVSSVPTADRRRFLLAGAMGAAISLLVFSFVLTVGWNDLLPREIYGNFYDAQARSLLAGHWDVPAKALYFEGFRIHGKTFTYFGVWPSVARMPVLELFPSLAGRMTRVSMLLSFGVFIGAVVALHWRIRALLRPSTPVGRADLIVSAVVPIVAGCGSCALFLASRAWVYHEAILWGVAWSLVAYERIIAFTIRPTRNRLVGASAAVALALASRASLGFGCVVALALVAGGILLHERRTGPPRRSRSWVLPLAIATIVPLALFAYVNWSRFGSLFSVPWRHQVLFTARPEAARALDANGGSYFGLQYAPTTLFHYLRPDALGRAGMFPWVTFPRFRTTVFGGAVIDMLDVSSSVPASMPALALLSMIGTVATFSRRAGRTGRTAVVRAPLVGAASGIVFVLTIAFIAQRYLGDWLPFLVLGSLIGLHTLLARRSESRRPRACVTAILAVVGVLALAGLWINGALAVGYQRLYNPQPDTGRAGMIGFQSDVDRALGGAGVAAVDRVAHRLGVPAPAGTTRIVGACDALYWSDGSRWNLVEGSPQGGVLRLRAALPQSDHRWHPLVSWGPARHETTIAFRRVGSELRITTATATPGRPVVFAPNALELPLRAQDRHDIEVVAASPIHLLRVRVDGDDGYLGELGTERADGFRIGFASGAGLAPSYGAPVRAQAPRVSVCRKLLDRLG